MGKLTNLPPRLSGLPAKVSTLRDAEGHSAAQEAGRSWYSLARWRHPANGVRIRVFKRDRFTCQICGRLEPDTSKLVADHKTPHRGDEALFWDLDNVWTLDVDCHNTINQAEEAATRRLAP
jgi:5-methylcytosine-specific restriction protein A